MNIKVLDIKGTKFDPLNHPNANKEKWEPEINAKIYFNTYHKRATLFYQGEKFTSNGWTANHHSPERWGWNFSESEKLLSREPSCLTFSHLFPKSRQSWVVDLFITGDSKHRSMVDLADEIIFQIEIQREDI